MTEIFATHCEKTYKALEERATEKVISTGTALVFVGSYAEMWNTLGISQSYYSPVKKCLIRNGAIEQLQKGGRNTDTVLVLHGLPSELDGEGWLGGEKDLTKAQGRAKLSKTVGEIEKSLGGINVVNALLEMQNRFDELEKEVKSLRKLVHNK